MTQIFLSLNGPNHAELRSETTLTMGLSQFWIALLCSIALKARNSMPNITAHARGTPIKVETRLDAAFNFIASHVGNPNHFLQRKPSTRIIGIKRIPIAGRVKKIIGTP